MNYYKIYNDIINRRIKYPIYKKDQYCEKHHIIPKSLNGSNDKSNLVNLTAREHYIAHLLLWKHYKSIEDINATYKMASAISKMINGNSEFKYNLLKFNSKLYERTKIDSIQYLKSLPCPTKGKRFVHHKNTHKNIMIPKDAPIPPDYIEGEYLSDEKRRTMSQATKGKIYIRNNITNELKLIDKTDIIPDGWSKKRTKLNLTEEQKQIHRQNARNNKGQLGKILIINNETGQGKFIFPDNCIPDGWHKRKQNIIYKCIDCGKYLSNKNATRCKKCSNKLLAHTRNKSITIYNINTNEMRKIPKHDPIPIGWKKRLYNNGKPRKKRK